MATDSKVTASPDWSAGTLETRYYDALHDIQSQYLGFDDENYILNDGDLTDIILRWERRYKDTYDLYIDNEDDIKPAQSSSDSAQDAKVVLLRRHKDRWQACCYYGQESSSTTNHHDDSSTDQHSALQSSGTGMHGQTSDAEATITRGEHDQSANGVNNTSTSVDSIIEKLVNTLESLVTGVGEIALAIETQKTSEGSFRDAVDNLMASIDKITQDQTQQCSEEHSSKTSTEYDLGFNTPSTLQDVDIAESVSGLEDCDDTLDSASHSNPLNFDDNVYFYHADALDRHT